jgi:hypothetical protein
MEFDENDELDEQQGDAVEIYSRNAVLWFSILADPLIGGILLMINLWTVGYKKAMWQVAAFIIVFEAVLTTVEYWLADYFHLNVAKVDLNNPGVRNDMMQMMGIKIAIQVGGALILTRYFYKKYFPDDDYYPKSILQPLLITVFIMLAMQYYRISF